MYEFSVLTLKADDLKAVDWAQLERDAAAFEPQSVEGVKIHLALVESHYGDGVQVDGVSWDDEAGQHVLGETLLGEPAADLLRRLASEDVARLKGWLAGEAFEIDWQEGYGQGAELILLGGGALLRAELELSGGWSPMGEEEEEEAKLQETAYSTLLRLGYFGLLERQGLEFESDFRHD